MANFKERILSNVFIKRLTHFFGWKTSYFPKGHFHSVVPSKEQQSSSLKFDYADINMDFDAQFLTLQKIAKHYSKIPFKKEKQEGLQYYFQNKFFSFSDGVILWCLISEYKPKLIIEIGSGFSTACMLDTIKANQLSSKLISIDPSQHRSEKLIPTIENSFYEQINKRVSDLDMLIFNSLKENDILFIDTSHTSKKGSEIHYLLFKVFPILESGVIIHFHDVFRHFEYPQPWTDEGIYWNEQYLLRAFLQNNDDYEVLVFSDELEHRYESWYKGNMPLCLNPHEKYTIGSKRGEWISEIRGQSLWLRKK
ncbi:MAG: class I SAM-dependent methyltransferase [Bacteroidia bacterium]|nr:class I SAM-dependent methyltransferase [Bacteroidia bacterium]